MQWYLRYKNRLLTYEGSIPHIDIVPEFDILLALQPAVVITVFLALLLSIAALTNSTVVQQQYTVIEYSQTLCMGIRVSIPRAHDAVRALRFVRDRDHRLERLMSNTNLFDNSTAYRRSRRRGMARLVAALIWLSH